MRAGAEREARIQAHRDVLRISGQWLVVRHDPQPAPEAHGVEILQPFALPGAIGDVLGADALRRQLQRAGQRDDGLGPGRFGRKQRLHHGLRPQADLARRGFEDGVVHRVGERHRHARRPRSRRIPRPPDRAPAGPPKVRGNPARLRLLSFQPEPSLQVMDVEAAFLEGRVAEDFLVQRRVGLDAVDHQFGQRVLHARDRRVRA